MGHGRPFELSFTGHLLVPATDVGAAGLAAEARTANGEGEPHVSGGGAA